jgi:hypothetical protein
VPLATAGTITVTVDTGSSDPATTIYLLSDPCSVTSCLAGGGTVASAAVAAGTYYILIDSSVAGGMYDYSVTCP